MSQSNTCPVRELLRTSLWDLGQQQSEEVIWLTQEQILQIVHQSYWKDMTTNSYNYARAHWLNEDEANRYAEISNIAVRLRNEQEYSDMVLLSQKIVDFDSNK